MKYELLNNDQGIGLVQRLLSIRNISDDIQNFLYPSFETYRQDPFDLHDMDKGVTRFVSAMKSKERIMIFGDYDVDGISSSFLLYTVVTKFFGYKNISIQFPDRIKDGYGLKNKHIDMMKQKNIDIFITVDNGITSVQEALYAKKVGIDMIITDHHEPGKNIPDAIAVINPKLSPDYACHELCGAGVVYKFVAGLLQMSSFSTKKKKHIMEHMLPIVAIATVADVVPLVHENRVFVKKGLEQMTQRKNMPESLSAFLDFVNLNKQIDSYHIGFVIGPRINAGGRIQSPYDSLATLLHTGEKQQTALEALEKINIRRRKMQEKAYKIAEKQIALSENIAIAADESFHEGIVGIVAGRLSEKFYKPSAVFKIATDSGLATASLRAPIYFDVMGMIRHVSDLTERSGGHRQAGGMTVKIENLEAVIQKMQDYCRATITDQDLVRVQTIDTYLATHERDIGVLDQLAQLGPFGQGNEEPSFLFANCTVVERKKVGQKGKGHLKLEIQYDTHTINGLFWSKGDTVDDITIGSTIDLYGKVKIDSFNGGYFVDIIHIGHKEEE